MDNNTKIKIIRNLDWTLMIALAIFGIIGNNIYLKIFSEISSYNVFSVLIIDICYVIWQILIIYRICILIYDVIKVKGAVPKIKRVFLNIIILCFNTFMWLYTIISIAASNGAFDREYVSIFIQTLVKC